VEASSPALIERVRNVVTDDQGRYRLIDLRPGKYKVTFALAGFSTFVREDIDVSASFVATVNADLKVATLEETVTVSGQTPVVDVQQASKTLTLTRDLIDALPSTRNVMSVGAFMPGLRQTIPDVGGSRYMEQTQMFGHGASARNTTFAIDGLMMNANKADGATQNYYNDQLNAEITITTSALPAEIQAGGAYVNNIPKDGGNTVNASVFLGYTNGNWQSDNVTDELRAKGLSAANSIEHIQNFTGVMGGPIRKDKLWILLGGGNTSTNERAANAPLTVTLPDGTQWDTVIDQYVRSLLGRATFQVTPKNKISVFHQRNWKQKGKDFSSGTDPYFSSSTRPPLHSNYNMGLAKWSAAMSNRMLIEVGFAENAIANSITNQPWTMYEKYLPSGAINPQWLANTGKTDTQLNKNSNCLLPDGCTTWGVSPANNRSQPGRQIVQGITSYVTGTHSFKTGVTWSFGTRYENSFRIGDLVQNYVGGVPSTVTVYTTPNQVQDNTPYDLAFFFQDTISLGRFTINPGVRLEYFSTYGKEMLQPEGRFHPPVTNPKEAGITFKNDVAPRFSMGYDVFGDGKTALKASASKYYAPFTGEWGRRYTSSVLSSESRNWFDADLIPGTSTRSGVSLATNGDGIAQDNEIGPSANPNFGKGVDRTHDPDFQKFYNWEYTASIQRQIVPGMSVNFGYFRRTYGDLAKEDRTLITLTDYSSFQTKMPADISRDAEVAAVLDPNEILTVYNLNSAKRSSYGVQLLDTNTNEDKAIYNGLEAGVQARLPNRIVLSGSWTADHMVQKTCDTNDDPNGTSTANLFGNGSNVAVGGRFCDQTQFDVPWMHEFKLLGSVPLPYGVGFATSIQAYPGLERTIIWTPPASLFPGGRTNSETVILTKPGQLHYPRYSQVDINFKKTFRRGSHNFTGQFDLFNVMNSSGVLTQQNNVGTSLGQPLTILQGRLPRVALQVQW